MASSSCIQKADTKPRGPLTRLQEQPMGTAYLHPPNSKHGVSFSLPTWQSLIDYFEKGEKWKNENLDWCYPRFLINAPLRHLAAITLQRLDASLTKNKSCLLFPTSAIAKDCKTHILKEHPNAAVHIIDFSVPNDIDVNSAAVLNLASFSMALFPSEAKGPAKMCWINAGGGLSTRQALFCNEYAQYLHVICDDKRFDSQPALSASGPLSQPLWMDNINGAANLVKSRIARFATPESPDSPTVSTSNVTLYPTGMSAIYNASLALESIATSSTVVAFGWIYNETIENLKDGSWNKFIGYKRGTEQDLQDLTDLLKNGERIGALFCEIPSNVFLSTVPLQRLRALADQYGFPIACDDSVAGFVNLDLMPHVDVLLTSLTKSFSGASNVTGGSVTVNPASQYHDAFSAALHARYEPACVFPLDVSSLEYNSRDLSERIKRSNETAVAVVTMLNGHPLIQRVNHPSIDESLPVYKSLMRKDGGYGHVMSVIFHDAHVAQRFYDVLALPKGSSFGTNFTIAIPFTALVYYHTQDEVAAYGLPGHTIRISIGLENAEDIKQDLQDALAKCCETSLLNSNL